MTRRDAGLTVIRELVADRPDQTLHTFEVVERLRFSPTSAADIRITTAAMGAAVHRPGRHRAPDLGRVGRGRYRLITAQERLS